ncbi:MAG: nucleotidyltransferase domain-containing protein [Nitrospinae bacterium]|nr:nucleotidyltransferase domain-containing protein [Nitrospinota bacterium]
MGREEILDILRDYKRRYAEKYGILEIGVFGSVARDEAHVDSDVDICVKTSTPDAFALVHIKEDIESLVGKHVDIIRVRDRMNPFLKKRIEQEGLYV